MKAFEYSRARGVADAVAQAQRPGAMYLGGGTNLVDLMRLGVATPDHLVDVSRLSHDQVEETPEGGLRIGAAMRNSDLARHPLITGRYPVLAQAVLAGASGQVRNMATAGGNLLQRTRCAYFQDTSMPCNKRDPGSGCPAIDGDHSNLAILGHSVQCVATHPSDMAVALAALDARVHVAGPGGGRVLAMHSQLPGMDSQQSLPALHRLPGDEPWRDTVLEPGELITAIELPPAPPGRSMYRKVRERASFAFALVSVAASVSVADGVIAGCKLALGGVAHVPWRAFYAERAVARLPATHDSFAAAADAELRAAAPLARNVYKVALARNLIIDTLLELCS
jgi:xanthine dehydrogenase YagS FAD-binding subunit